MESQVCGGVVAVLYKVVRGNFMYDLEAREQAMWTHGGEHSQEANNKAWGESLLEVFKEGKEAGVAGWS